MQPLPTSDSINSNDQLRKRELKNAYSRKWYANLTPEEKTARLERQREKSKTPARKESLRNSQRRHREVQKHTLHPDSIAMENPLFTPELVWPTAGASRAHGTTTKSNDWVIPKSSATPLYIPPPHDEVNDEGCDELLPSHMTHRSHVPSGQRHALLTHRNTMFECRIGSNTRTSNKDGDCKAIDQVDVNRPLTQSDMTNNGKY
jgi:hypothetical protein